MLLVIHCFSFSDPEVNSKELRRDWGMRTSALRLLKNWLTFFRFCREINRRFISFSIFAILSQLVQITFALFNWESQLRFFVFLSYISAVYGTLERLIKYLCRVMAAVVLDVDDVSTMRAIPLFLISCYILSVSMHRINIYVKYLFLCLVKKSWLYLFQFISVFSV